MTFVQQSKGAGFLGCTVPIQPLLSSNGAFSPEEISVITTAFEDVLRALGLADRKDPAVSMVAKQMLECARDGERDPILLREVVLNSFRNDPNASRM